MIACCEVSVYSGKPSLRQCFKKNNIPVDKKIYAMVEKYMLSKTWTTEGGKKYSIAKWRRRQADANRIEW